MFRTRFTINALGAVLLLTGAIGVTSTLASPSSSAPANVKILTCTGKAVNEPATFVISCADGNAELTATKWSTWSATSATGVTLFGLNLCTPDCALSSITFFPDSKVRLSAPEVTKHGRLYSSMVVHYKLHGKSKAFSFSWKGDPSFQ